MAVKRHTEHKKNSQVKRSPVVPIKVRKSRDPGGLTVELKKKKRKETERLIATVTELKKEGGDAVRVHKREETNMMQMKKQ